MASVYYYVDINTSADAMSGTGIDISAFNYSQFLTQLSRNDETTDLNYFYLKGYRNITETGVNGTTNRWLISKGTTEINSWGTEPWKINCSADFYFESILDWVTTVKIQNGFIQCDPLSLKFSVSVDYVNFTFENCWLRCGINDGLDSRFSGGRLNFINCTLQNFILENFNYNDLSFINTIIYNDTANPYYLIQNIPYTYLEFNNVISNRWIYEPTSADNYNVLDPTGSHFIVSSSINSDSIWDAVWSEVPYSFNTEISAIVKEDISYLSSGFSAIDISGNTNYTSTWYDGVRDGIGALYFPPMSGVAVSASSASAPTGTPVYFVISGNDPFTNFRASSATYYWDDGTGVSSVNNNSVISHTFSTNGSYQVESIIDSKNKWYSITVTSWTVYVGGFNVTIVIYDHFGNNITGGQTKPLNRLTFSATVNGVDAGSYFWNLGDGYSASVNPSYQSYLIEGLKNIGLSAYSLNDPTFSATDTSTITISATSSVYYVNIVSAYDVCANNVGTSADPFNWSEFKGRVETSGEYLDMYRLSGSRVLSGSTGNSLLLNVDKTKKFTIRDWDVWNYGPWVLQAKDFTVTDNNSVINAAGCTLQNGIIYNKRYNSPGYGGQLTIGTTYDMFIVYQGNYSHIIIDPYQSILSGAGIFSGTSAFTVWTSVSSTSSMSANYCIVPVSSNNTLTPTWLSAWANSRNLSSCYWIEDDFETSSFNCWWGSSGTLWTAQLAAVNNNWTSVTYGNGLYVAVATDVSGTSGVMTSPDGVTWTSQSAAENNSWNWITYGNGLFVAVADNDKGTNLIMTSPDGVIWTLQDEKQYNNWASVTYGNGLYVAVAKDGVNRVITSPDGTNWTLQSAAENNSWISVTYGNGLYVAVAQDGTNRVMTSPNGSIWTSQSAAENNQWYGVTYGNGLYVAVASDGTNRVMTSPNGSVWTSQSAAENNQWRSVTYGNGLFVAVSQNGIHRVMTSPDGVNWTAYTAPEANAWLSVTSGANSFVAVSLNGNYRVMTSENLDFSASYDISSVSGSEVAIMKLKDQYNPFRLLSRNGTSLSGDFIFETSLFYLSGGATDQYYQGISVYATSADVYNYGSLSSTSGCIIRIGAYTNASPVPNPWTILTQTYDNSMVGVSGCISNIIYFKIQRDNNIIRTYLKDADEGDWRLVGSSASYLGNVYAVVDGNGYYGFDYFRLASQSGLPNTYNLIVSSVSSTSSTGYVSGTPITVITSAHANLVGSTIYLSAGSVSAWKDSFTSATYSAVGQNNYDINLTDSVFTNFIKENNNFLSASNLIINNCTFNNTVSAISANTSGITINDCQFGWESPADYPFTSNNDLYDKEIDYIIVNKRKLRPFDGFTIPPNPGLNYSAYPGYETGLFGYSRKDYITSAD